MIEGVQSIVLCTALMAVFHKILRHGSIVLHALLGHVVFGVALLEQSAAFVFLIRKDALDRAAAPDRVPGRSLGYRPCCGRSG